MEFNLIAPVELLDDVWRVLRRDSLVRQVRRICAVYNPNLLQLHYAVKLQHVGYINFDKHNETVITKSLEVVTKLCILGS